MDWKLWAKSAGIRALKTFAQTAASGIVMGAALHEVNWILVASVSCVAAILSILTSVAGLPEVKLTAELNAVKAKQECEGEGDESAE